MVFATSTVTLRWPVLSNVADPGASFHGEGGKDAYPKVFKVQLRPNPLAH